MSGLGNGRAERDRGPALPYVRVRLIDGRTLEGYRADWFEDEDMLVFTSVPRAYDSEMQEIVSRPTDANIPRTLIESEEVVEPPAAEPEEQEEAETWDPWERPVDSRPAPSPSRRMEADAPPVTRRRAAVVAAIIVALAVVTAGIWLVVSRTDLLSSPKPTPAHAGGRSNTAESFGRTDKLAFVSDAGGTEEIFVINPDGSGRKQVTHLSSRALRPDFSPDGRQLAFASEVGGQLDVLVATTAGQVVDNVTDSPANEYAPDWSPDGEQLALISDEDGDLDLYLMDARGGELARLGPDTQAEEGAPDFSPDGSEVAFASRVDGDLEIYVIATDGSSGPEKVTNNSVDDFAPQWSPDGGSLIFDRESEGGDAEIFVKDLSGASRQLTDNEVDDRHPAWAPDGGGFFFGRLTGAGWELLFATIDDGKDAVRITQNSANDFDPAVS